MIKFVSFLPTVTVFLLVGNVTLSEDATNEGRVVYDQRQTGKYNIHVSIKDVSIIELDRNDFREQTNSDPDYYYDDNDYTIKPLLSLLQSFNASKPSTTTEKIEIALNLGSSFNNFTSTEVVPPKEDASDKQSTESSVASTTKKASNVIILGNDLLALQNYSMLHENGGQIPVQIVMEPLLHPKYKAGQQAAHKSTRGKGRPSSFRLVGGAPRNPNFKAARSSDEEAPQNKAKFSILEKLLGLLTPPNDHDEEDE